MAQVDRSVFTQLREGIKGGFDEDRFGSRIGFGNLKRWGALDAGWGRLKPTAWRRCSRELLL